MRAAAWDSTMPQPEDGAALAPESPCLDCGACCATFRVSFYWAEADDAPGGTVPVAATEVLNAHLRCMRGTNAKAPRCSMLEGRVPGARCTIYDQRPSPCRELEPYGPDGVADEKCQRARVRHGLPALPQRR